MSNTTTTGNILMDSYLDMVAKKANATAAERPACSMTRDEIISLARKAGGMDGWGVGRRISDPELRADNFVFDLEDLERFAALVDAAERQACAAHYADIMRKAVEEEREACAKVSETLGVHPALNIYGGGPEWYKHGQDIATAIRARGTK